MTKSGRNDPCPCGSGKKYKKCCAKKSYLERKQPKVLSSSDSTVTKIASLSQQTQLGNLFQKFVPQAEKSEGASLQGKVSIGKVEKQEGNA